MQTTTTIPTITITTERGTYRAVDPSYIDSHYQPRRCECADGCHRVQPGDRRDDPTWTRCAACERGKCGPTPTERAALAGHLAAIAAAGGRDTTDRHEHIERIERRIKARAAKLHAPKGFVVWRGFSPDDGAPIVAIATFDSSNTKTKGKRRNMVQIWILRADVHPATAMAAGLDSSVCGSGDFGCIHRAKASGGLGSCYVVVAQGPSNVYRSFAAGAYPDATPADVAEMLGDSPVRFGSYGDPGMVPAAVWRALGANATTRTGYTHQARQPYFDPAILDVCMVSADHADDRDALLAVYPGARAFTVYPDAEALQASGDAWCPADDQRPGGKRVGCADCGLCFGADRVIDTDRETPSALQALTRGPKHIGIVVHGAWSGDFNPMARLAS